MSYAISIISGLAANICLFVFFGFNSQTVLVFALGVVRTWSSMYATKRVLRAQERQ